MPDAQAAHETTMSALLTALAGANLIYGVGMLEMGITLSFEQLVMANDIIKMVRKVLQGIEINDETLAVEVIHQVGAGGDFLMQEHTVRHMRTEQSRPELLDRSMRYAWEKSGCKDLTAAAHERALAILANHRPQPLPENVSLELQEIIEEAEEKLGVRSQ